MLLLRRGHLGTRAPLAQRQVRREPADAAPRIAAQVAALWEGGLQRRLHRQQLWSLRAQPQRAAPAVLKIPKLIQLYLQGNRQGAVLPYQAGGERRG